MPRCCGHLCGSSRGAALIIARRFGGAASDLSTGQVGTFGLISAAAFQCSDAGSLDRGPPGQREQQVRSLDRP